jgi:predicted MFS family arabinose efflux permease
MRRGKSGKSSFYGWRIVGALAVTETISWGIVYYAFTVFIAPMERDLGWSRAELTGGFSLALLIMGAIAYPVGGWVDKHGARALMTVGSIAAALLVVAWSRVSSLPAFYAIWAGLGVCAAAVLYEPAFAIVAAWFVRRRGRALAIITFAAGLASTIFVPLSDALLGAFGWRDAVLILGLLLGAVTIPLHAVVLRRRPSDLGLLPDGEDHSLLQKVPRQIGKTLSDALHSRYFWLLVASFSLIMLAASAIRVHFIPFLIDAGIDPSTAAVASGTIGIMQVLGRLLFAPLESRLSTRALTVGIFALQIGAVSLLLVGTSTAMIGLFIVLFGMSVGATTLARPAAIASAFGPSHYGRISSVLALFLTISSTIAPVGAGLIYDRSGNYAPVLWIILIVSACATGLVFLAESPGNAAEVVAGDQRNAVSEA